MPISSAEIGMDEEDGAADSIASGVGYTELG